MARMPSRPQVASKLRSLGANCTRVTAWSDANSVIDSSQHDWALPEPLWWSKIWWTPENAYVSSRDLPIAKALVERRKEPILWRPSSSDWCVLTCSRWRHWKEMRLETGLSCSLEYHQLTIDWVLPYFSASNQRRNPHSEETGNARLAPSRPVHLYFRYGIDAAGMAPIRSEIEFIFSLARSSL